MLKSFAADRTDCYFMFFSCIASTNSGTVFLLLKFSLKLFTANETNFCKPAVVALPFAEAFLRAKTIKALIWRSILFAAICTDKILQNVEFFFVRIVHLMVFHAGQQD